MSAKKEKRRVREYENTPSQEGSRSTISRDQSSLAARNSDTAEDIRSGMQEAGSSSEQDDSEVTAEAFTFKAVQSPMQIASARLKQMCSSTADEYTRTLDELSVASTVQPLQCYTFLRNCVKDKHERAVLLEELLTLLKTDKASYRSFIIPKANVMQMNKTDTKIPRLYSSLRKWLREVNLKLSCSLQNIFLCIEKPDPFSDPNFVRLYQSLDKSNPTELSAWVQTKVSEWNQSERLLREVLTEALQKALDSGDTDNMPTFELIQKVWLGKTDQLVYNGYLMFWSLKDILHAKPDLSARVIKEQINRQSMTLTSSGSVDYISWVDRISRLAENLEEYQHKCYSDGSLLELFEVKYRQVLPHDQYAYDKILSKIEDKSLTWTTLLKHLEDIEITRSVDLRTQYALQTDTSSKMNRSVKQHKASNAVAEEKSPKKPKTIQQEPAVKWAYSARCALHPTCSNEHTNGKCKLQLDIRKTAKSLTQMLPMLEELFVNRRHIAEKKPPAKQLKALMAKQVIKPRKYYDDSDESIVESCSSNNLKSAEAKSDDCDEEPAIPMWPGGLEYTDSDEEVDTAREALKRQRKAENNADRIKRKRSNVAFIADHAKYRMGPHGVKEWVFRGKETVANAARDVVLDLQSTIYAPLVSTTGQLLDRFRELYNAETLVWKSKDYQLSKRRYLFNAGLKIEDCNGKSKTIRKQLERWQVSAYRTPPRNVLTDDTYRYSINHTTTVRDTVRDDSQKLYSSSHRIELDDCSFNGLSISPSTTIITHSLQLAKCLLSLSYDSKYDSIVDTGATTHILRDTKYAKAQYNFVTISTKVALGDHGIALTAIGKCNVSILIDALIVPKMSLNLISGSQLNKAGYTLVVRDSKCEIYNHHKDLVFTAHLYDGLYYFRLSDLIDKCGSTYSAKAMPAKVKKPTTITSRLDVELLHKRFGHASMEDILTGLKNGVISGYKVDIKRESGKYQLQNGLCKICMKAKSHKAPFYNSLRLKASQPGEYIVCDIQGPYSVETLKGERYVITYTDWHTRYSWTYLLTTKDEALSKLKHLLEVIFRARGVSLRHYHSDGAGELKGSATQQYLEREIHATHSYSEAYTPARNGIAERKFRTLAEMTAAMLFDSGLPKTFWGYAYLAATHIRNRVPTIERECTKSIPVTPYELWSNIKPNIHYFRRWGCKSYVHIPKELRTKIFPEKVKVGFLVGYNDECAYVVYIPEIKNTIGPTVQVSFDEDIPNHNQSYFEELNMHSHVSDVTDADNPETAEDYLYLVNTQHIDDEDGTEYRVTRIAIHDDYIVAYRTSLRLDGQANRWEDDTPIHVKDIIRMTISSNIGTPLLTGGGQRTTRSESLVDNSAGKTSDKTQALGTLAASPSEPHCKTQTLKRKAATLSLVNESTGMSEHHETSDTSGKTNLSGLRCIGNRMNSPELHPTRRDRHQRILLNVHQMGNIASHTDHHRTERLPKSKSADSTYRAFHAMVENEEFSMNFIPTTYKQAMESNDSLSWQKAIDKELKSIADNNVFSFVDKPPQYKLQSGRFLFKIKFTGQGLVYKARLIAHGFKQTPGSDYWETYAPVSSSISTRIYLTMCATYGMIIHQMDIDTAFLIADLVEDIYMAPPLGMTVPDGKVLKLHKCLYGLKQSPRYFNQHLVNTLIKIGFTNLENEPCLFKKIVEGEVVLITVYVDDILVACVDMAIIQTVKDQLTQTYKMKDMGEMDWYLGMRCARHPDTGSFKLDQTKYTEDVLLKFDQWLGAKRDRRIPMEANLVLAKWTKEYNDTLSEREVYLVDNFPYRQVVGSLLYASIWTRPDISFAIGKLAKFNNHPTMQAIHATQWLLQYMRCTKHYGLVFIKGDLKVYNYVDSSFADNVEDRRSTAGQITYLGYSPIQWDSFVCDNYTIPCSVAEAEYVAASESGKVMMGIRNMLIQLDVFIQKHMIMFEDNQACITIALQEASKRKTKHVELSAHYIRDLVKRGLIVMVHIPTSIQLADIFTKPVGEEIFNRHLKVILGQPPSDDLLTYLNAVHEYNQSYDIVDNDD